MEGREQNSYQIFPSSSSLSCLEGPRGAVRGCCALGLCWVTAAKLWCAVDDQGVSRAGCDSFVHL